MVHMKVTLAFKNVWQWQVTSQIEFVEKEPFVYVQNAKLFRSA